MLRSCWLLGWLAASCAPGSSAVPSGAPNLPLRTSGRYILGADGHRVRFACVNWYGAHMEQMAMNGLNRRNVVSIAEEIAELGFNCVRLPLSLDMVFGNQTRVPDPGVSLAANPGLQERSPLEVFDATLAALTDQNLMVILNNHVSSSMWCCTNDDGDGLWYTKAYPMGMWLEGLEKVTARYKGNPLVVGFDLRNEVRGSELGYPSWGSGMEQDDWAIASVAGAKKVLGQNEDMLIIISGLYFGIFLCDVPKSPVHLTEPLLRNRTVYTAHEYNWFNFHLVARNFILAYFSTLLIACSLLWGLLFIGWWLVEHGRCSVGCMSRLARRVLLVREGEPELVRPGCCTRRLGRYMEAFEFGTAAAFTLASVVCLCLSSVLLHRCSFQELIGAMAMSFLALLCFFVSLVLWLRLSLACVKRHHLGKERRHEELLRAASPPSGAYFEGSSFPEQLHMDTANRQATHAPSLEPGPAMEQELSEMPSVSSQAVDRREAPTLHEPCGRQRTSNEDTSATSTVIRQSPSSAGPENATHCRSSELRRSVACLQAYRIRIWWLTRARSKRCLVVLVSMVLMCSLLCIFYYFGRYEAFAGELDTRWGFLLKGPHAAPIWLGEFGTDEDDLWWKYTNRYIVENEVEWAYWSINGQKRNNKSEPFGLLKQDSISIRHAWKIRDLQSLMRAAGLLASARSSEAASARGGLNPRGTLERGHGVARRFEPERAFEGRPGWQRNATESREHVGQTTADSIFA